MSTWIYFKETDNPGKKTKKWNVYSVQGDEIIGYISWLSPWRQYTLIPITEWSTWWNAECLNDVAIFLREQNKLHTLETRKPTIHQHL